MPAVLSPPIEKKSEHHWRPEHIADFWDWCSQSAAGQRSYFTAMLGQGIAGFLRRHSPLNGRLLDFGCGTGHLLEILLQQNRHLEGYGLEFSPSSSEAVEQRLKGHGNWRGVTHVDRLPTPFADESFQAITLIETIEHLKEDSLHATLRELYRLLAERGRVLITTPFEEDLEASMVYCPFCRSEFHRMQHMRSFSRAGLRGLLERFGFQVLFCENINLRLQAGLLDRLLLGGMDCVRRWIVTRRGLSVAPRPHLVAVATK